MDRTLVVPPVPLFFPQREMNQTLATRYNSSPKQQWAKVKLTSLRSPVSLVTSMDSGNGICLAKQQKPILMLSDSLIQSKYTTWWQSSAARAPFTQSYLFCPGQVCLNMNKYLLLLQTRRQRQIWLEGRYIYIYIDIYLLTAHQYQKQSF